MPARIKDSDKLDLEVEMKPILVKHTTSQIISKPCYDIGVGDILLINEEE